MDSQQKRRIIFTALARHFHENELYKAMLNWQNLTIKYPRSSLPQRIDKLCRAMKTDANQARIFQDIKECQNLADYLLKKDPLEKMRQYAADQSGIEDAPARSFAVLIVQIGRNIDLIEHPDLPTEIKKHLLDSGIHTKVANAVHASISQSKPYLIREEDIGKYESILNAVYVSLCESLGPVRADEILSQSTQQTDKTKYGKAYSSTNFL